MNQSLQQMLELIDILNRFSLDINQPIDMQRKLYHASTCMIANPDIYGDVKDIAVFISRKIKVDNNFNVTIDHSINYSQLADKLTTYIPS